MESSRRRHNVVGEKGRRFLLRKKLPQGVASIIVEPINSKMKGVRLVFSSCEARLLDERARKNAKMAPFNSNFGGREGT